MQMSFIMLVSQYGQFKEAVYGSPNLHPMLDQIKNGMETSPFLPEFECDFKRFKKGLEKENYIWITTRQLTYTQELPRLVRDYLRVHPLILNVKF